MWFDVFKVDGEIFLLLPIKAMHANIYLFKNIFTYKKHYPREDSQITEHFRKYHNEVAVEVCNIELFY